MAATRLQSQQLAAILKASTDAIITVDVNRVIQSWNPAATHLFGYRESEAVGRKADELLVPEHARPEMWRVQPAMHASKQAVIFEAMRNRKDGSLVWVEINILPMLNAEGDVSNVSVIYRDISDRIKTLQSLRDQEERYSGLLASIDAGFCIIEMLFDHNNNAIDYLFLEVNSSFEQQSGLHGAVGKRMRELSSDIEAYWFEIYGKVAQTGEAVRFVNQAKALDERWFDVYACRIGDVGSPKVGILFTDITDRRCADAALRASEAKLRLGFGIAGVGLGTIDYQSDCIVLDETGASLLDLPANIAIARTLVHARFHPDDLAMIAARTSEALEPAGDGLMAADHRIILPDGTIRWVSARKQIEFVCNADGSKTPIAGLVALRDITARIKSIEALSTSELLTRSILESSPDCIKVLDQGGRIEFVNANGCMIMEIDDKASVLGVPWQAKWPASMQSTVKKAINSALLGIETRFEAECPTFKGNLKWWDVIISPIVDGNRPVSRMIAASRDVTRSKQAETLLVASKERLRLAANAARLTYIEIDFVHDCLRTADNFFAVMGYSTPLEEVASQPQGTALLLAHVVRADRQRVETAMKEFFAGRPQGRVEYRVRGDDGIERWIDSRWSAETMANGKPRRAFATNLDITERKRAEEHSRLMMAEVNHRAKNLLGVVQAVARQTARRGDPASFLDRLSERISGLAASHDLLAQNEWTGVAMVDLAKAQLAHFKDLIGTRILLEGPPARLTVAAAQGIGMALHELATNAGKYGALCNDNGRVRLSWRVAPGDQPAFCVEWSEENGPPVTVPSRSGFGQIVIGRMAEAAVEGTAKIDFRESGLMWELTAPIGIALEPNDSYRHISV